MENEQMTTPTETPEPIHTDAEAELMKKVSDLEKQIAELKAENQKLFLRVGGGDGSHAADPSGDELLRKMVREFQSSGYDPSKLFGKDD